MKEKEQLFTIKLWQEALTEKQSEWRGKIQHIGSGDSSYFRDLSKMMDFITRRLSGLVSSQQSHDVEPSMNASDVERFLKSNTPIGVKSNDEFIPPKPSHQSTGFNQESFTSSQERHRLQGGFLKKALWMLAPSKGKRTGLLRSFGIIVIGVLIFVLGLNHMNPIDPKTTGMVLGSKPVLVGIAGFFHKLRTPRQRKTPGEGGVSEERFDGSFE
jgi:hypothetical protein